MADSDFDVWTASSNENGQKAAGPIASRFVLSVDVAPLDAQFGRDEETYVPEALSAPLFGQLGEQEDTSALATYAILDAAKIAGLAEVLATSGLEYRCFYKGELLDELGDVAPWIVRLEPENRLTQNLFTKGDAPWHLWEREAGIYIRSSESLETLWRHFRKFTKVQDSKGSEVYFRFWEPYVAQAYLSVDGFEAVGSPSFFHGVEGKIAEAVICCSSRGEATIHYMPEVSDAPAKSGHRLTLTQEKALARGAEQRRREDIVAALCRCFPEKTKELPREDLMDTVGRVVLRMGAYGIRKVRNIHVLASWQMFYGDLYERRDPNGDLYDICRSAQGEDAKLMQMQRRMDVLHGEGVF